MTVELMLADNDKVAAIVIQLCKFLAIGLSRTQETLIYIVLVVLGLECSKSTFAILSPGSWP